MAALVASRGSVSRARATLRLGAPGRARARSHGRALLSLTLTSPWTVYVGTADNGTGYWDADTILGRVPWDGDSPQVTVVAPGRLVPFKLG